MSINATSTNQHVSAPAAAVSMHSQEQLRAIGAKATAAVVEHQLNNKKVSNAVEEVLSNQIHMAKIRFASNSLNIKRFLDLQYIKYGIN